MRVSQGENLPKKLEALCRKAGIGRIGFGKKYVAIKLHFGESGNLAYLRPNYAKVLVDLVKEEGGWPFLLDCSTLYAGRRKNALEHLELAYEHGFSPFSTGCHIIIGDGLTGSDEVLVPVKGAEHVAQAHIGRAVMDADCVISLTHFKGHVETGFGGVLKNVGMGCGSRAGKREMHAATGPKIDADKCIGCRKCARFCASDAISYVDDKAVMDSERCAECGFCIAACPTDAIFSAYDAAPALLGAKIAEYTKAVLDGRPSFHVSLAIDISPFCDCWSSNDAPIVPDIGMFASFDPVALDAACADAVNAQSAVADSLLGEKLAQAHEGGTACEDGCAPGHAGEGTDYFRVLVPNTDWKAALQHAVKLGIGTTDYRLIEV
jgi:uncharacterized Fe-S center protein